MTLKRRKVPLMERNDHQPASKYFSSAADYVVIETAIHIDSAGGHAASLDDTAADSHGHVVGDPANWVRAFDESRQKEFFHNSTTGDRREQIKCIESVESLMRKRPVSRCCQDKPRIIMARDTIANAARPHSTCRRLRKLMAGTRLHRSTWCGQTHP